jgi:C4-dicarboxylate-specific signal transduction histidine kinase
MNRAMRNALKNHCGVSIYRDGFRVWPYGGPGDDWLELNQRRVNNPTMRVSTNQVLGIVDITQERNPELQDRTSREGLLDTPAFRDLKTLLLAALARLEERRFASRQAVASEPAGAELDPLLEMVSQLRSRSQAGEAKVRLLDRIAAEHRRQQKAHEVQLEYLMRLAGIGLAAEQLGAEISHTVSATGTALRIAQNTARQERVPDQVTRHLEQISSQFWLLEEQLDAMEPLYTAQTSYDKEPVDVRTVVQHAATVFAYRLQQTSVRLILEAPTPVTIHMSRSHLLQVLLHLFDNAFHWLSHAPSERQPEIRVRLDSNPPGLVFADNGPGVRAELRDQVFRPFFTGRGDGRGLGLHMARAILDRYGFSIELLDEPKLLSGANFRMVFGQAES